MPKDTPMYDPVADRYSTTRGAAQEGTRATSSSQQGPGASGYRQTSAEASGYRQTSGEASGYSQSSNAGYGGNGQHGYAGHGQSPAQYDQSRGQNPQSQVGYQSASGQVQYPAGLPPPPPSPYADETPAQNEAYLRDKALKAPAEAEERRRAKLVEDYYARGFK